MTEGSQFSSVPVRVLATVAGMALVAAVMAAGAWLSVIQLDNDGPVLSITACTPESWEPGIAQAECERPYADAGDSHRLLDPITVAGEVCNLTDRDVSANVSVWATPVETGQTRILLVDAPVTYTADTCEPYNFPFDMPSLLAADPEDAPGDLGSWKLTGQFTFRDHRPIAWDATSGFVLIP